MKKYFKNVTTLEELRKQYKELLKMHHPDNPKGSTTATQEINAEYDSLFQILKDKHDSKCKADDTEQSNYDKMKYDFTEDLKLREVLQKIINFEGIDIEIIGCWIWADGDTYRYREQFNKLGFRWARDKKKWYYHTEAFRKRSKRKMSIDDIRDLYGSTEVKAGKKLLVHA